MSQSSPSLSIGPDRITRRCPQTTNIDFIVALLFEIPIKFTQEIVCDLIWCLSGRTLSDGEQSINRN